MALYMPVVITDPDYFESLSPSELNRAMRDIKSDLQVELGDLEDMLFITEKSPQASRYLQEQIRDVKRTLRASSWDELVEGLARDEEAWVMRERKALDALDDYFANGVPEEDQSWWDRHGSKVLAVAIGLGAASFGFYVLPALKASALAKAISFKAFSVAAEGIGDFVADRVREFVT